MSTQANTKIWKRGPDGAILVKAEAGLPYGTEPKVFVPGLGQTIRTGIQPSGSGTGQTVLAVYYTLS